MWRSITETFSVLWMVIVKLTRSTTSAVLENKMLVGHAELISLVTNPSIGQHAVVQVREIMYSVTLLSPGTTAIVDKQDES